MKLHDRDRTLGTPATAATPVASTALALALALTLLPGCRAIEGIFKAGVWTGVIVIAFLVLVAFGVTRMLASR